MCGIAGFCGPGDIDHIEAMTNALAHRGPDGHGYHVDKARHVFLGHRRLAILDIAGGAQPMWNEDKTVAVIFNGEIYNHLELRALLQQCGHRFESDHSDTEVLVHGYEEWGHDLPRRLNGMFAFAIWDTARSQLFLARDRFGEKPLFYSKTPGFFAFSSELPSLASHPAFDPALDKRSLQKLFAYGFFPAPCTPYRHAAKLPGGCSLCYDLRSDSVRVAQYWQFALEPDSALLERSEEDLADELDALLTQAVRRRLISDVPLGIFLSGGIDSSAVLAAASELHGADQLRTFTIGFNEPSFDESEYAECVAGIFHSRHSLRKLDLEQARDTIPDLLAQAGEPLGDSSLLPTYLLCQFTRQQVTVALSGDGADELFAGYDPFHALKPAALYQHLVPAPLHRMLRKLISRLPVSTRNMGLDFKLKRTLTGLSYGPELWNPTWLGPLPPPDIERIFGEKIDTGELYEEAIGLWNVSPKLNLVDKTMEFYTRYYLQDGILTKVDRAAMLNSLETRAIFLDNDMVDFCRRLPTALKYRNGVGKYLLKKVLARKIPSNLVSRPKKGFGIPLALWLREIPQRVPMDKMTGINLAEISDLWQQHRRKRANYAIALWVWLSLQAFRRPIPAG
ncbi:asparagine synthase (glutamine-hydrolyzing) [Bradyrhizobium lablabi]|uniref:asparagine synthase (glutamine-hydrolyzing) n=1 Tax=Bradyrhizobium lablabi TaxID=722472 RepID=UPI001BAA6525|nr:asparagine synthase (glutamine-hydrolyzing) [Bradyrhizobium lablabi]MBR0695281.1 asparagine synthase (glutamine-hydrolyzing) [Bradyrhizobium lablabi]